MKEVKILQKPSGSITIGGDLNKLERKFYNGLLFNVKKTIGKKILISINLILH